MSNVQQNAKASLLQRLDQTPHSQIVTLPEVADRFINLYSIMNGKNLEMAKVAYESEKFHFMKLLQDKPELQKCTKLSLYGCFLDMAVQGLSFDPAMKHAYVVSFPTNIGTKDNPQWENRATLMIDGRGELVIRTRQGQIRYADNPVVVWSCDYFKNGTRDGKKFVEHEAVHPRPQDAEIIACYLRISRPDNTVDFAVMDIEDINDLKAFSKQPGSLAWTKGLKGMVETKTIKHAFKSYPKVKLGNFSKLQTEAIEPSEETTFSIDYGFDDSKVVQPANVINEGKTVNVKSIEVADDEFTQSPKPAAATAQYDDDNF